MGMMTGLIPGDLPIIGSPVLRGKRQVARYLGVGETVAADLMRRGVIPSFTQGQRARVGLVRFVLRVDADAYLARLRDDAVREAAEA
jgi:hypothetical protein